MRFSITVLVAIQASMGLAHAIPLSRDPYTVSEEKQERFTDIYRKLMLEFEAKKFADHGKHESKKHYSHDEYSPKNYYPQDYDSEERYDITEKYEPKGDHTVTKVNVRKYYPHKHHKHEDDNEYRKKYNNHEEDHRYKDHSSEDHYYQSEKDDVTKEFDAFDDYYGLDKHDFDKYFTQDEHDSLGKYEPEEGHDSKGHNAKRWPPERSLSIWNSRPFGRFHVGLKEPLVDPNAEHRHSYKFGAEIKYPEPPKAQKYKYNPKDVHDFSRDEQPDMDIFKPGYSHPEKYEAEVRDDKLSHFHKPEQENDNLPYFDTSTEKYLPKKQPFDSQRETIPKAEYGGEDERYHSIESEEHYHNKEDFKKPDYDKEDQDEYNDDPEEEHPKHNPSPKGVDKYGMTGVHGFKYEHHPDKESFLSEEAHEKLKHGGSDQPKTYAFKKYYPKEEDKKEEKYPNAAKKYGYRKYDPKEEDIKHGHSDEKSHPHKEEDDKANHSEEYKKHASKQLYYPNHHEPKESAKYYRKQEVSHGDHSKAHPYTHNKDEHHGYYKEPGYEKVVPGFMWAGPGTVTKTPCAKKDGCPHGHWHMLEPKNGEHRRIGITGTNIVVEPDYKKPDYKEDTVNHVLPGYENVIPGFEWAGAGVVTEVPCRSVTNCPEGGWFMLAPKLGEHRRIAMNYPKATATPYPRPAPEPAVEVHKSDYKARSPVGHEGILYGKDHEENDGNEREYKLIHRHSRDMAKRSIEARAPCKKAPKKEEPKKFKKIDPNVPLPRLRTVHLLNIEKLSDEKRQAVVDAFPMMDDEFKKEFLTFQELTPEFITKLNELYAILLEDPNGKSIIEFISRRPRYVPSRKRSTPELGKKEIEKIEGLSPAIRQMVAKRLDFGPELTVELANADKLSDDLIEKLNKEYARVLKDPKYAKVIEKYLPKSKRSQPELSKKMLSQIEALPLTMRQALAKKLDFDPELSQELANTNKLSYTLIQKLNKEYARVFHDPKYAKIVNKLNHVSKRAEPELTKEMLSKVERMSASMRMMAAQKLDMDPELTTEMANADKFTPELIEKLNKEYARISKDPKYKSLLDKIGSKQKRADKAPELSKAQLEKIEGMSPTILMMAGKKLGMDASLVTELANADKFTPELVKKLNKEYARVYSDPKYKDVIKKFGSKSKRSHRFLNEQQIDRLLTVSKSDRRLIAEKLNFKKEFADEFINSEEFTPHLLKKLNEVYSQIYEGHKYNELVDYFRPQYKRQVASDPKEDGKKDSEELKDITKQIREQITKDLNFDVDLDGEFDYAKNITESFIEKLGALVRETIVELEWEELVEDLIDEDDVPDKDEDEDEKASDMQKVTVNIESSPNANSTTKSDKESVSLETVPEVQGNQTINAQNSTSSSGSQAESDQRTAKIASEQPAGRQNATKSDLDEKLEQSKKNGWCNEFLGTLKNTWDDSVDDALSKTKKKDD